MFKPHFLFQVRAKLLFVYIKYLAGKCICLFIRLLMHSVVLELSWRSGRVFSYWMGGGYPTGPWVDEANFLSLTLEPIHGPSHDVTRMPRICLSQGCHHFTNKFFVRKFFVKFFSNFSMALKFFGKGISAQKLLVKCW